MRPARPPHSAPPWFAPPWFAPSWFTCPALLATIGASAVALSPQIGHARPIPQAASDTMEAVPDQPGRMMPGKQVPGAADLPPSALYAASPPVVLPGQARLALVIDGIGLDHAMGLHAIAVLPPSVTLAFSPYATAVEPLVVASREAGHEMLASLPMEPDGSPLADEGDHELRLGDDGAGNARALAWALSATPGVVGATDAETGQTGGHVANADETMRVVTDEVRSIGLIYVEANPGCVLPVGTLGLVADVDIRAPNADDADGVGNETRDLAALEDLAEMHGRAVGIAGPLNEASLARLVAWLRTLPGKGITLVPASSLARPVTLEAAATTDDGNASSP